MDDFDINDGVLLKYSGHDRDVVVPEGTIAIGEGAFKDNDSIASLVLPDSLKEIGSNAFANCVNLAEVEFPSKLETIGARAFFRCESLAKIRLGKSIKTIGFAAFGFTKIKDIFYNGTIEEFGAIKATLPPEFGSSASFPFSDSSSGSMDIFGNHSPKLRCKDVKDDLYRVLAKLQGLAGEGE